MNISLGFTSIIVREWLNGGLIPLDICIMAIIAHSILTAYKRYGPGWTNVPGVASACALWWIFLADLIRACLAWQYLHQQTQGRPLLDIALFGTVLYIMGGLMAFGFTFRLIFVLSPKNWGHRAWLSAMLLTLCFMLGLAFIH